MSETPEGATAITRSGRKWRWKTNQPILGLMLYGVGSLAIGLMLSLLATMAEQSPATSSQNTTASTIGFQTLIMLCFVIYSACTDRGDWNVLRRILWILACLLLAAVSMNLTGLIGVALLLLIVRPLPTETQFVIAFDLVTSLLGALPIILWAMWRSSHFVKPVDAEVPSGDHST